ncbi:MAG TPA: hypothetical protein VGR14_15735 [Verrucomicrobiae bacterium]|nr:hypothetical protein [Verrucomicrobiae bacterium]
MKCALNNTFRLILAGLLAIGGSVAPALAETATTNAETDRLSFRDGDVLYGKLLEIQPGKFLRWQHPDSSEPIDFKPESVAQIGFAPRPPSTGRTDYSCKLWLANGDALAGNLIGCDRDALTLDTWYAGKLKIPRRALQTLAFNPRTNQVLFDGLTGLDGWTQGDAAKGAIVESGQWTYRDGAFYADKAASIARDLKLPDRSQIQFDMAWRGPLYLAIALYTDSLQPILLTDKENGPDFGAFYSLRFFNTIYVTLTPIRKKDPLKPMGDPLIIPSLTQKDRVHVDLRMSKADRRVALFIDGMLIKDWIDPSGFAGDGGGVRLVNNQQSVVKISNFRVSRWNGVLDDSASEAPDPSHDVVLLESGAKTTGAVVSIADGQISLLTAAGAATIPIAGTSAIEFARFQGQSPPPAAANAHATFRQGGAVTFELSAWRPDGIAGISPDFGKVTFDPAAFVRLQFLSADPKPPEEPKN